MGEKKAELKREQTSTSPKFNFSTHTQVVFPSFCSMQWLRTDLPCSLRKAPYLVELEKVALEPLSHWIVSGS